MAWLQQLTSGFGEMQTQGSRNLRGSYQLYGCSRMTPHERFPLLSVNPLRVMQRKPMWFMLVSIICGWRAAGR
jgi:hypothetical protein